jgi:hypothetical protein
MGHRSFRGTQIFQDRRPKEFAFARNLLRRPGQFQLMPDDLIGVALGLGERPFVHYQIGFRYLIDILFLA